MAQIHLSYPLAQMKGKLGSTANSRVMVTRQKHYGKDPLGRPIDGPMECYVYNFHEGAWSPGATANREAFREAQHQARQQLADPERHAYWKDLFDRQLLHPAPGAKRYTSLLGFVVSRLRRVL